MKVSESTNELFVMYLCSIPTIYMLDIDYIVM